MSPNIPANGSGVGVLLADGARRLGHAPFLTFYDDTTGEQTELSYATFDNWLSKAANLLSEELGVRPGTRIESRIDRHWTAAVVAAAAWRAGAVVVLGGGGVPPDVLIVPEEEAAAAPVDADRLLVVGAALGGRVSCDPPGVHFGDEVLAFGDHFDDPGVPAGDPALEVEGEVFSSAQLLEEAAALLEPGGRALSTASLATRQGLVEVVVAPAVAGGSVVWCPSPGVTDLRGRAA